MKVKMTEQEKAKLLGILPVSKCLAEQAMPLTASMQLVRVLDSVADFVAE